MSTLSGLEIFERIAQAGGRILRVEAEGTGASNQTLALTFDVGRVVIQSGDEGLAISTASEREVLPDELVGLEEEEPWWRLAGHPLTAAWPGGVEEGVGAKGLNSLMVLKLRFREESDNPRILCLEAAGRSVRVSLEGT